MQAGKVEISIVLAVGESLGPTGCPKLHPTEQFIQFVAAEFVAERCNGAGNGESMVISQT